MRIPLDNPPEPITGFGVPDRAALFGRHAGIDYPVGIGTKVYASVSGKLTSKENVPYHGNVIDIESGGKWYRVMHLSGFARRSGEIKEGELIGYSGNTDGNTGNNTGAHLHWDVRNAYNPSSFNAFIDPNSLINSNSGKELTMTPEAAAAIDDVKKHVQRAEDQIEDLKANLLAQSEAILAFLKLQDDKSEDLKKHIMGLQTQVDSIKK